jgi:hypothetical protein
VRAARHDPVATLHLGQVAAGQLLFWRAVRHNTKIALGPFDAVDHGTRRLRAERVRSDVRSIQYG